jgi:hypothetical protein
MRVGVMENQASKELSLSIDDIQDFETKVS